eukprot:m.156654 g.156654  ORF g.156654 m.156654 type:complete len:380 (-) comp17946_c0_seq1:812-1951(-)
MGCIFSTCHRGKENQPPPYSTNPSRGNATVAAVSSRANSQRSRRIESNGTQQRDSSTNFVVRARRECPATFATARQTATATVPVTRVTYVQRTSASGTAYEFQHAGINGVEIRRCSSPLHKYGTSQDKCATSSVASSRSKKCRNGDHCKNPRCTFLHSFTCITGRCNRARRNGFDIRDKPWKTCCRACALSDGTAHDGSCASSAIPFRVTTKVPVTMYHGTSTSAWEGIKRDGFKRAGCKENSQLGRGVYLSYNINKTNRYRHSSLCRRNNLFNSYNCACDGGVVIQCTVDIGKQYTLDDKSNPMRKTWQDHGYDSAYAAAGVIGKRPEFCISDPRRIKIVGLACAGHEGWMVCIKCKDMIYSPKTQIPQHKYRCKGCR